MAFKIGGTLGNLGNRIKKMDIGDVALAGMTAGGSLAYDAVTGKNAKDQLMNPAQTLGIEGKSGVAGKYKAAQAADAAARAQAAATPTGISAYKDQINPYIQQFGANRQTVEALLADTTSGAYQPLQDQLQQFGQQPGVQANVDPAFRQYQMGLAQQLQQQAMGQGPSVAQMQLQQATDQSLNQSLAGIRAASGANGALGARTAALAGAQQLGQMGGNSAILRLQEQQQAQQALAGLSGQARQGDIQGAELAAQTGLANRGQQLDALGMQNSVIGNRISGTQDVLRGALGIDVAGQQAKRDADTSATQRRQKQQDGVIGAGVNIFSGLLGSNS